MPTAVDQAGALGADQHGNAADIDSDVDAGADDRPTHQAEQLRLRDCLAQCTAFVGLVSFVALRMNVPSRALTVRTLLHLPRVARWNRRMPRTEGGFVTPMQVQNELIHSAARLRTDIAAVEKQGLISSQKPMLQELIFEPIDAAHAEAIFSSLHYLRSARAKSLNFALLNPADGLPVSLCSVSRLEWNKVGNHIEADFDVAKDKIWDVTRVFSCDVAPPNVISYLLARVRTALRNGEHDIDLLITAVDPNLGFAGSSYRAANWQRWLSVQPRPYLYHNRRYASPRQLRDQFGTSSLSELQSSYPGKLFEQSKIGLLDSYIFCCQVKGGTKAVPLPDQHRLHR